MAFGRRTDEETSTPEVKPPAKSRPADGGLSAFIDQGSSFEGKLAFKDTVRIDGAFRGDITSENTLVVGETGEIEANIDSQTVIVSGSIIGDVKASQKVVLHKTATVEGNLHAKTLVVEEGATFNGQITMTRSGDGKGNLKSVQGGDAPK